MADAAPAASRGASTILVVEANPITRNLVCSALAGEGHRVIAASEAADAIRLADAEHPALVVHDLVLPDMDGLHLLERLRSVTGRPDLPAVILTGHFSRLDPPRDLPDVATTLLGKPVVPVRLIEAVHGHLGVGVDGRPTSSSDALVRQGGLPATALGALHGITEALASAAESTHELGRILVNCLDAAGLSTGLLYVADGNGGLRLEAQAGLPIGSREWAASCFGDPGTVLASLASGSPVSHALRTGADGSSNTFWAGLPGTSALIVPIAGDGLPSAALVLASDGYDLGAPGWLGFARTLADQFPAAVTVCRSVRSGATAEATRRTLMELTTDAILVLDQGFHIIDANARTEELLARPRHDILGRSYTEFVVPEERYQVEANRTALFATGTPCTGIRRLLRSDGKILWVEGAASLVSTGEPRVMLTLHDITSELEAAAALGASERLYESVVSDLQEGIVLADAQGRITRTNRSAERIIGIPEAQLLGLSADDASMSTFRGDGSPMPVSERPAVVTLRKGRPCSNTIMGIERPEGGRVWLSMNTQPMRDGSGAVSGVVTSFTDITEQRATEETLHALSARVLRMQDDERRRLAGALHDSSGSALTALALNLAVLARSDGAHGARERAALESAQQMVTEWGDTLRTLAYLLHPPLLEEAGLLSTLRWHAEQAGSQGDLQIDLDLPRALARLGGDTEIALFRFVQEALTNVKRHSGATRAVVRLAVEDGRLRLSVADDGRGIAPDLLHRLRSGAAGGMGVAGMRERARQLPGGRLDVVSGPSGTTVTIETVVPVPGDEASLGGSP